MQSANKPLFILASLLIAVAQINAAHYTGPVTIRPMKPTGKWVERLQPMDSAEFIVTVIKKESGYQLKTGPSIKYITGQWILWTPSGSSDSPSQAIRRFDVVNASPYESETEVVVTCVWEPIPGPGEKPGPVRGDIYGFATGVATLAIARVEWIFNPESRLKPTGEEQPISYNVRLADEFSQTVNINPPANFVLSAINVNPSADWAIDPDSGAGPLLAGGVTADGGSHGNLKLDYTYFNYQKNSISDQLTFVEIEKMQYRLGDTWTDVSEKINVCVGTDVDFRVLPVPADAPSWPAGKPVWGGEASGTGVDQVSVVFTEPGTNYITAECGNTVTGTVVVLKVELELKNTGTIVGYPEYDKYHVATNVAGGLDALGPLPMGEGNKFRPNQVYVAAHMMIGKIEPFGLPPELEFRWQRGVSEAGWFIMKEGDEWHVIWRERWVSQWEDDTQPKLQDTIPSEETNRIYDYDAPGINLVSNINHRVAGGHAKAGDYVHVVINLKYTVEYRQDSTYPWLECAQAIIGQKVIAKRIDETGFVPDDWEGIENSTAVRELKREITEEKVRAIVGGDLPIIMVDPHP